MSEQLLERLSSCHQQILIPTLRCCCCWHTNTHLRETCKWQVSCSFTLERWETSDQFPYRAVLLKGNISWNQASISMDSHHELDEADLIWFHLLNWKILLKETNRAQFKILFQQVPALKYIWLTHTSHITWQDREKIIMIIKQAATKNVFIYYFVLFLIFYFPDWTTFANKMFGAMSVHWVNSKDVTPTTDG